MNLTINNTFTTPVLGTGNKQKKKAPAFTGIMDGAVTSTLNFLNTNDMANAVLIDLGAMVTPRTCYDAKHRNKDAGFETFFREISGTFINCLSAGLFALGISHLITNKIMPEIKIKPDIWFSDDAVKTLNTAWKTAGGNTKTYVKNIFENMSGKDGSITRKFTDIDWKNINWIDRNSWLYITWQDEKYKNIPQILKTRDGMINTMAEIIDNKTIAKSDKDNILKVLEFRLTNALGVNNRLNVNIKGVRWNEKLSNILRDTYVAGKEIFTAPNIDVEKALTKVARINKIKIFGALALSSAIGLTNQALNRKLTEKRTGKKGFVGDTDYVNREAGNVKRQRHETKDKFLFAKKLAASVGMIAMIIGVMKVKSPKDFVKKLQFTGPVTSGNAIKTVYGATLVGRFMAADNGTELRESVTRDYFGFLNWLVFGGFAAKGVANLLDRKREVLFNITKDGKGVRHWLNDINLKTHAEIAAKGTEFARKNMWKLNAAHISGLLYSGITLGYLLPMINDRLTKAKAQKQAAANRADVQFRPE